MGRTDQEYKARQKNRLSIIKIFSKEARTLKIAFQQFEGC